jgi:hypothetical protein
LLSDPLPSGGRSVPIAYGLLLLLIKDDLLKRRPTQLNRATAFLWADYHAQAFWWEPFEMCRKLTLTGAVLLIGDESEQARVLVALLVSLVFLSLHLSVRPLRR